MSAQVRVRPTPWRLRSLTAVACAALPICLLLNAHHRQSTAIRLQQEIRWRDGTCEFGTPTLQRFRNWLLRDGFTTCDYVRLISPEFHNGWLKESDDLSALRIGNLDVEGSSLDGNDIARLIDGHPIRVLNAPELVDADKAASALGRADRAYAILLDDSDLTDSGLHQLPLERVEDLDVSGTAVTARGIDELRRCRCLQVLILDGMQINDRSVSAISTIRSLEKLQVVGENVTDETVQVLHAMHTRAEIGIDARYTNWAAVKTLHAVRRSRFLNGDP